MNAERLQKLRKALAVCNKHVYELGERLFLCHPAMDFLLIAFDLGTAYQTQDLVEKSDTSESSDLPSVQPVGHVQSDQHDQRTETPATKRSGLLPNGVSGLPTPPKTPYPIPAFLLEGSRAAPQKTLFSPQSSMGQPGQLPAYNTSAVRSPPSPAPQGQADLAPTNGSMQGTFLYRFCRFGTKD